MSNECSKCGAHLILVPPILEGYPEYWTCTKCDADNCKRCGGEMILCPEPHYWVCSNCYHMNHPDCEVSQEEREDRRIQRRWISVKDAFPKERDCIVYGKPTCGTCGDVPIVTQARFRWNTNKNMVKSFYFEFGEYDCGIDVTHWMPLPEPPFIDSDETDEKKDIPYVAFDGVNSIDEALTYQFRRFW